jgi:hypothetical protein
MADVILTGVIALLTLIITGLGMFMGSPKPWHRVTFGIIGVVTFVLIIVQAGRNADTQEELRSDIKKIITNTERSVQVAGFLQHHSTGVSKSGAPLLTENKRSFLNVAYVNKGSQPVDGARNFTELRIVTDGNFTNPQRDTEAFGKFMRDAEDQKKDNLQGSTVGVSGILYGSVKTPEFTKEMIGEILRGETVLYVLGHAYWSERPQGSSICLKLQPPDQAPVQMPDIVWRICEIKKT